uniref:Endonuclease/exonuclease/phosphatase domain-containing protein n=1 Tax=Scophthalmus maximus TaxID=52904 RepID=A0A8D3AM46_SCOMX
RKSCLGKFSTVQLSFRNMQCKSRKLRDGWISQPFHSNYNSKEQGTSILLSKTTPYSNKSTVTDPEGCFIIINGNIEKDNITITSIYGPNADSATFFHSLFAELANFQNSHIILGGDFNTVLNPDLEHSTISTSNNGLTDIYSPYHKTYSRIDYFLNDNSHRAT